MLIGYVEECVLVGVLKVWIIECVIGMITLSEYINQRFLLFHLTNTPAFEIAIVNIAPQAILVMGLLIEKGNNTGTNDMSSTKQLGLENSVLFLVYNPN